MLVEVYLKFKYVKKFQELERLKTLIKRKGETMLKTKQIGKGILLQDYRKCSSP